ncbi:MAG: hypothetical protein CSA81_07855 [Acidobacteria bacterium]|nr:MAG: hypothetical protein CSA81_07855 [Acidobacteriota bacterium]
MSSLFCLFLLLGANPEAKLEKPTARLSPWEAVLAMEELLFKELNSKVEGIRIQSCDPVRGYMIGDSQMVLIVPVHHSNDRNSFTGIRREKKQKMTPVVVENLRDHQRKARAFNEELNRKRVIREANFEAFIREIKAFCTQLKPKLKDLNPKIHLQIIVEERDRLWISSIHTGESQFKRRVITLSIPELQNFSGSERDIKTIRHIRTIKPESVLKSF